MELWRSIPGQNPRYEVSDLGKVRSLKPSGIKILKQCLDGDRPYLIVGLSNKSIVKQLKVHRLVLFAFVGLPEIGQEGRHLNGNSTDNRLENLCWGTHSENMLDKVRHGTHHHAIKTHCVAGHPYSGQNLYLERDGSRKCRTCHNKQRRKRPMLSS